MRIPNILHKAGGLVLETLEEANAAFFRNELEEVKRLLVQCRSDLGDIEGEVPAAERDMRAQFEVERLNVDRVCGRFGERGYSRAARIRNVEAREIGQAEINRRVKSVMNDFISLIDDLEFKTDWIISRDAIEGQTVAGPAGT